MSRPGRSAVLIVTFLFAPALAFAQANGQLQIHQLNVGQGDAALVISPLGETMLIDTGPTTAFSCASTTGIITQLTSIGLTRLDYHVASHYHADHIGCSDHVVNRWPVQIAAYDRGTTQLPSTQVYARYASAVSLKRQTVTVGQQIVLDAASANPVTFQVVAVNGNGSTSSDDENNRSVVLVLRFGSFDATFGGDAESTLENRIASSMEQVELYKVHHHGSATSSTATFVNLIHPRVATMSMGSPNAFDHPTATALNNLHAVGATVYWTTSGDGAAPGPQDIVANGRILTQVPVGGASFNMTAAGNTITYSSWPSSVCTYSLDPTSASFTNAGGGGSVSVSTQAGCGWSATSNAGFIAVTGGSSGSGPGTVSYTVTASSVPRNGSMTIAGLTFLISQAAPPFTDDPLTAQFTTIKAVHLIELRTRIDALRERFGLGTFSWTNSTLLGVFIQAIHINEMRTALGHVYETAGETQPTYTDPTLGPGLAMRAAHVQELRAAITTIE